MHQIHVTDCWENRYASNKSCIPSPLQVSSFPMPTHIITADFKTPLAGIFFFFNRLFSPSWWNPHGAIDSRVSAWLYPHLVLTYQFCWQFQLLRHISAWLVSELQLGTHYCSCTETLSADTSLNMIPLTQVGWRGSDRVSKHTHR